MAILTCGIAAADTIVATGIGAGVEHLYIGEDPTDDGTVTDTNVYFAGIIDINVAYTTGGTQYARTTMCVQLFVNIDEGTTYNSVIYAPSYAPVTAPTTNLALEQIAWLEDNEMPASTDPNLNTDTAGLQLAIWKIAEDGEYLGAANPFSSGRVTAITTGTNQTNAAVLTAAEGYLSDAEINGVANLTNVAFVYENSTQANPPVAAQMLEGPSFSTGPQPTTPENSTFVLAGVALLALGHTARRRLGGH
jgi:hypothetical protein